jgi:hypothetical protein
MRSSVCCVEPCTRYDKATLYSPQKITVGLLDYAKMFVNWLFLFKKAYSISPGLYFTGDKYDRESPLLVTCNFLSTIIILQRRLKPLNVRLLVVDTNGINVWCSAAKGKFSSEEILKKLELYDRNILTDSEEIDLIIPKLSLSGVKLSELKRNKIKPIIGPLYAKKLRAYIEHPPYKDCAEDAVQFGIKARLYTVVPTIVQFSWYAVLMALPLFILNLLFKTGFHWQIIPITIAISIFYPVLFPWLPGNRFAIKALGLATLFSLCVIYVFLRGAISLPLMFFYISYIFGTSVFFALSYTGNSSISNYSKVRKEIAHFLPLSVLFYAMAIMFYLVNGS